MHIQYNDLHVHVYCHALAEETQAPLVVKFTLPWSSLLYYYILNLSDPCPSVDKKRRRNIACSLYDHPLTQGPCPGGYEI